MIWSTVAILFFCLFIGVPVGYSIGISGLASMIFVGGYPIQLVPQKMVAGINSFPLLAAPLFIFAGEIMGRGGLTERIVNFASALLGWLKGGIAIAGVMASMIFAGLSGSAAADTSAIGTLVIPAMTKKGYKKGFSASLVACSGALGPIIPPSINMIVYGSITGDSIAMLFMGGILPGILIGGFLMLFANRYAVKHGIVENTTFSWKELALATRNAIWALIVPVIILGGILSGMFTATEAGIVACIYSCVIGFFVYRQLTIRSLIECTRSSAVVIGMISLVLATCNIYNFILSVERVGDVLTSVLTSVTSSPQVIMLMILALILIMGCFMDMLAATIVLVPILHPVILSYGINPIQFGVMFCIACVIGGVTPPVGNILFISMGIAKTTLSDMIRYLYPALGLMVFVVLLCIFFPGVVLWIPSLVM